MAPERPLPESPGSSRASRYLEPLSSAAIAMTSLPRLGDAIAALSLDPAGYGSRLRCYESAIAIAIWLSDSGAYGLVEEWLCDSSAMR